MRKSGYGNTLMHYRVTIASPPHVQYRHTESGAHRLADRFPGAIVEKLTRPVKGIDS